MSGAVPDGTPVPEVKEAFGDSAELADELIELVLDGPKRATAGAVAEFELEGAPLPEGEGDRTRVSWLEDHERFFCRYLPTIGVEFSLDMPTVFERFEVPYSE